MVSVVVVMLVLLALMWRDVVYFSAIQSMGKSDTELGRYAAAEPKSFAGRAFDHYVSTRRGRRTAAGMVIQATRELFPNLDESLEGSTRSCVIGVMVDGAMVKVYDGERCVVIRYQPRGSDGLAHLVRIQERIGESPIKTFDGTWSLVTADEADLLGRQMLGLSSMNLRAGIIMGSSDTIPAMGRAYAVVFRRKAP